MTKGLILARHEFQTIVTYKSGSAGPGCCLTNMFGEGPACSAQEVPSAIVECAFTKVGGGTPLDLYDSTLLGKSKVQGLIWMPGCLYPCPQTWA